MRYPLHNLEHKLGSSWYRLTAYPVRYLEALESLQFYQTYFNSYEYRITAAN